MRPEKLESLAQEEKKLFSEYLLCQLVPLAELQRPAQTTTSNTDNLTIPILQTPLRNHTHLLFLLPSCRLLVIFHLFLWLVSSINPFNSDGLQGWVLGPLLSLPHNLTLGHLTPSQRVNADNPPPNSHLQHRPLPESQTLRFTGYQPSTPGCPPGTTTQHVYSRWWF